MIMLTRSLERIFNTRRYQMVAHLGAELPKHNFLSEFQYKIDHISETKNRKIDFSFVSAHCTSFMQISPLLKETFVRSVTHLEMKMFHPKLQAQAIITKKI